MTDLAAFEHQLSSEIADLMGPVRPVDDAAILASITATRSPRSRVRSLFGASKLVVAAAIVAVFGAFLLAGVLTTEPSETAPAAASPSASPEVEYTVTTFKNPAGFFLSSVATDDAIWAPGDPGPGVSRLDSVTNELTTIELPGRVAWNGTSLVPTDDAIWVVGASGVTRIDRGDLTWQEWVTREQDGRFAAPMSGYGEPIITDGSLWIMSSGSTSSLVEIDLAEPAIRAEYPAAEGWSRSDDRDLWMGAIGDAIWLSSKDPDGPGRRLTRFDLSTRQYTDVIDDLPFDPYQGFAGCCVVGDVAIWIVDARTVSRFDIATLSVTDTLEVGTDLQGAVATPGAIWVVDQADNDRSGGGGGANGTVVRIDTSTREATDIIEVGAAPEPPAFLHGAVWVANHSDSSLSRIDVDARQVTDTVPVPVHPHEPLGSDGVIWVYTQNGEMARIEWGAGSEPAEAVEPAPTPSTLVATPPIELPAETPDGIESGTLETPLSPARWAHLHGSETTLPTPVYPLPMPSDGYIALDQEAGQLWMSPDLITWSSQSAPLKARDSRLTVAGDAAWLTGSDPASLWHSSDALEWSEVHLEALMPPEPAGPWLLELGPPVTFGDTTVVPFSQSPDPLLVHLAMGGTREDRVRALCCRGAEGGLYRLSDDKFEDFTTVRFEVADGGLRVIDADGMEMAFLDGVELGFIELLAFSDGWVRVPGLAIVEQGGLVPVELPDDIRGQPDTAFVVDAAGFVAYGLGPDGLVHVHRSEDGRTWREAEIIGDDPGEPTEIVGVGRYGTQYGGLGSLFIESEPHITEWTSGDGVTWESRHRADQLGGEPFASGWIEAQGANESGPWPGWEVEVNTLWYVPAAGEPVAIDVSALGLADPDGVGPAIPISSNTVLLGQGSHGPGPRDLLIITFDELPA